MANGDENSNKAKMRKKHTMCVCMRVIIRFESLFILQRMRLRTLKTDVRKLKVVRCDNRNAPHNCWRNVAIVVVDIRQRAFCCIPSLLLLLTYFFQRFLDFIFFLGCSCCSDCSPLFQLLFLMFSKNFASFFRLLISRKKERRSWC